MLVFPFLLLIFLCQLCQWKAFFCCSSDKFLVEVDEAEECLKLLNRLWQVPMSNRLSLLGIS